MSNLNLMVGDWVKHNDIISASEYPNTVFQWDSGHWYDIETCKLTFDSIEPIPLSPEVMEKIGGMERHTGDKYYINIDTISIIFTPPLILGEWQTFFVFQYNDYRFLKLAHLHQLQQFIRLFTGKEIEVKWNKD